MERVLITGASGLLGSNLALELSGEFAVAAAYHRHRVHLPGCEAVHLDITRADEAREVLRRLEPDVVIHCAAETGVDFCEDHPLEAYRANVQGTENLARAAVRVGALVVYISTDSVFDGKEGNYSESARPHPVNVYAHSKLLGEQVVREHAPDHLIVRTNLYGWSGAAKLGLAEWILDRLDRGQVVPGFQDVHFSPILANDLARVLVRLIDARLRGTFHVGAAEGCSKLAFANLLCSVFGKDPSLVRPAHSSGAGFRAPRPPDTSLDVARVSHALGWLMPGVEEGLRRFRQLREEGHSARLRWAFLQEVR